MAAFEADLATRLPNEIDRLIELMQEYNPLRIMEYISVQNCLIDPETYEEPTHEGMASHAEYALNVASSLSDWGTEEPDMPVLEEVGDLVKSIMHLTMFWAGFKLKTGDRPTPMWELRISQILYFLNVRGEWVPSLLEEHVQRLMAPHAEALQRVLGVDAEGFLAFTEACEDHFKENFKANGQAYRIHAKMREFVEDLLKIEDEDERLAAVVAFNESAEAESLRERMGEAVSRVHSQELFHVSPGTKIPEFLLQALSIRPGENTEFNWKGGPRNPANDSRTWTKPFLRVDNNYYLFAPHLLHHNPIPILEDQLRQGDPDYFQNKYLPTRGAFLEEESMTLLASMIPSATQYSGLKYWVHEEGQDKLVEADGLLLVDDVAIILEAKSGFINTSSRRGGPKSLESDVKALIDDPLRQACRTRDYLKANPRAEFTDKSGNTICIDASRIREYHVVTTTLTPLGPLGCSLPWLQELEWLTEDTWPWAVFVGNLRIIADLVEGPAELLQYMRRRAEINNHSALDTTDEMDMFMLYLTQGLYVGDGIPNRLSSVTFIGLTVQLDNYYARIAGHRSEGPKPRLAVEEPFRSILRELDSGNIPGGVVGASSLIDTDPETRRRMLYGLKRINELTGKDGLSHNFSMANQHGPGWTFATTTTDVEGTLEYLEAYCEQKMRDLDATEWTGFCIKDGKFQVAQRFTPDGGLAKRVEARSIRFGGGKHYRSPKKTKKVGRNDACPCGSGKKYKRCCIK